MTENRKIRIDYQRNFIAIAAMLRARPDATNLQIFEWFGGKITRRTVDRIAPRARKQLNLPARRRGPAVEPSITISTALRKPVRWGDVLLHPPACNAGGECVCGLKTPIEAPHAS